ncbi:MAG TPA: phage holin family protein [Candidatus Saccharibacteria bacterium]|nr:phage holin family protein [Candidatus Saccharibacteria bacterium]
MKKQFGVFLLRCLLNSFGLWITVRVFGTGYTDQDLQSGFWVFILAGIIFSIVNALLKPLVVVLSLPAILLTLGLFTIIVNGLMVYIALKLTPGITMTFWYSVLAGMILSLINYIVSTTIEMRKTRKETV